METLKDNPLAFVSFLRSLFHASCPNMFPFLLLSFSKNSTAPLGLPAPQQQLPQPGALVPMGAIDPSSLSAQFNSALGAAGGLGANAFGQQPNQGILPTRPNLPEDPVIPHNGFATHEEGEKAFHHLLRKAGVDPTWTWDMTMRTIITDPLYKALNTLAEKKAAWQKVNLHLDGCADEFV
jgi:hypothetical protein